MEPHPGISMHRIAVGGGVMGALFALGTVLIVAIGVPLARWFLAAALLLGGGVGFLLYLWHKRKPVELTDLSTPPARRTDVQPRKLR